MEAFLNLFASRSVQNASIEAVCENFHALPEAWRDGSRLAARQEMLHASYLAGFAFTNNFVGYVHAIAHAVGALYHIPHGRANAVLLLMLFCANTVPALRLNLPFSPMRFLSAEIPFLKRLSG